MPRILDEKGGNPWRYDHGIFKFAAGDCDAIVQAAEKSGLTTGGIA
jgi:hypothetical protein